MKPGGGRAKGAAFERAIVKAIRDAFGVEREDVYRTPLSGGHFADSKHSPGDIQFSPWLREVFPVAIECKFQKVASLDHLFLDSLDKSYWAKWLEQASSASEELTPCLVARIGRRNYAITPMLPNAPIRIGEPELRFCHKGAWWSMMRFTDYLQRWVSHVQLVKG